MNKEQLKRLPFVVKAYQVLYPSESHCGICGLPWSVCGHKSIMTSETEGVFYVCPYCWKHSSLVEILEASTKGYMEQLYSAQRAKSMDEFMVNHILEDILDKIKSEYVATHK